VLPASFFEEETNDEGAAAAAVEQAKEENRTLRKQIAQMISLSQEEDAETEQLMQSMNESLEDARRASGEKDAEIERVKQSLSELKKTNKQLQQQQVRRRMTCR
jgi:DNA-binding ferritin-like protein